MKPKLLLMILMAVSTFTFTSCGEDYDEIVNGGTEANNGNGSQNDNTASAQWPKVKFDTYHVAQGGTLPYLIGEDRKSLITHLKVTGFVNSDDLNFIRMMTGLSFKSGTLQYLDLSEARIVAGGVGYSVGYGNIEVETDKITECLFANCPKLEGIRLPNTLKGIGEGAFYNCQRLKIVEIPNSVKYIGIDPDDPGAYFYDGQFYNSYNYGAFEECKNLVSINISNNVSIIPGRTFKNCSSLSSITIPKSVTYIGLTNRYDGGGSGKESINYNDAFYGCESLSAINVEEGNTTYDSRNNCNAIIEKKSNKLMKGCINTTIPNSVTAIGRCAFDGCSKLKSITIPNSVTSIEKDAFEGCTGLTSVNITDLVSWCKIDFDCYSYLIDAFHSSYHYGSNPLTLAHHLYLNGKEIKELQIPNTITEIKEDAFNGCTGLISITIPNSVTTIGYRAFNGCNSISNVTINSNSILSETSYSRRVSGIFGSQVKSYTIGDDVKSIGSYAFYDCSSMTSVSIPNSVTSIGSSAFRGCSGLTSLTIPNYLTEIKDYAFYSCSGLTSITIPASVTLISYDAFNGCRNIKEIHMKPITPPSVYNYEALGNYNATVYIPKGSKESYNKYPWTDFKAIIEE
ncbi:leucine-rich repeat domain-containing protein [Pseudoprevotella muciniphila]|nr:leucine-rich repeat domain-containing protein [Pseudoprevotella muciniphila]